MNFAQTFKQLSLRERKLFVIFALLATAASIGWVLFSDKGFLQHKQMRKELQTIQAENQQLKKENEELKAKIEKIQNDPAFLEEVARRDFNLLKKNEVVFEFK